MLCCLLCCLLCCFVCCPLPVPPLPRLPCRVSSFLCAGFVFPCVCLHADTRCMHACAVRARVMGRLPTEPKGARSGCTRNGLTQRRRACVTGGGRASGRRWGSERFSVRIIATACVLIAILFFSLAAAVWIIKRTNPGDFGR